MSVMHIKKLPCDPKKSKKSENKDVITIINVQLRVTTVKYE